GTIPDPANSPPASEPRKTRREVTPDHPIGPLQEQRAQRPALAGQLGPAAHHEADGESATLRSTVRTSWACWGLAARGVPNALSQKSPDRRRLGKRCAREYDIFFLDRPSPEVAQRAASALPQQRSSRLLGELYRETDGR